MGVKRRSGLVVGALAMAALAFTLRQDGLLPADWTPRPRSVTDEADEETAEEDSAEDESPIVEAPQRQSATPPHRVLAPLPLADVHGVGDNEEAEVRGEVRDRLSGEPIPNATLTFRHEDEEFETRSDADGRFRLATPTGGEFVLARAEAEGYFSLPSILQEKTTFFTSAAHSLDAVQIRLQSTVHVDASSALNGVIDFPSQGVTPTENVLRGEVLSLLGSEPISGAQIDVETQTAEGATRVTRLITADDGRFAYEDPASGPFLVTARASGFATETRTQHTREALVLILNEEAVVESRVVDEEGTPIPSFVVFAEAHVGTLERRLRARSDTFHVRGEFRLGGLSSGSYTISVAADGFAPLTRDVPLARGANARVPDFRLRRGATLGGIVRGEDGSPLADAHVQVESAIEGTGLPVTAEALTDDEGVFRVEGLSPGQVRLTWALVGHHPRTMTVQTSVAHIDLTLHEVVSGDEPQLQVIGTPP